MFWFLVVGLLLLSLVLLGVALLRLWRRIVVLGREVTAAGEAAEGMEAAMSGLSQGRSSATCPTCGGPNPPAASRTPARSR